MKTLLGQSEEFSDYLFKKYSLIENTKEDRLISEIRNFAPKFFFLPFLQFFMEHANIKNKIINSKYLLKLLIHNSNLLAEKDIISNIDDQTGIRIDKEKYVVPGIIVREILRQDLKNTYDFLVSRIKKIDIAEIQEYIFEHIDKDELIEKLYEEYSSKSEKRLIIQN